MSKKRMRIKEIFIINLFFLKKGKKKEIHYFVEDQGVEYKMGLKVFSKIELQEFH